MLSFWVSISHIWCEEWSYDSELFCMSHVWIYPLDSFYLVIMNSEQPGRVCASAFRPSMSFDSFCNLTASNSSRPDSLSVCLHWLHCYSLLPTLHTVAHGFWVCQPRCHCWLPVTSLPLYNVLPNRLDILSVCLSWILVVPHYPLSHPGPMDIMSKYCTIIVVASLVCNIFLVDRASLILWHVCDMS